MMILDSGLLFLGHPVYSTHFRQWRPMWSPLMELPYATLLRHWRLTWGRRQTFPYSTIWRHFVAFKTLSH